MDNITDEGAVSGPRPPRHAAPIDGRVDAPADAPADAVVDAPVDAPVDSPSMRPSHPKTPSCSSGSSASTTPRPRAQLEARPARPHAAQPAAQHAAHAEGARSRRATGAAPLDRRRGSRRPKAAPVERTRRIRPQAGRRHRYRYAAGPRRAQRRLSHLAHPLLSARRRKTPQATAGHEARGRVARAGDR